MFYSKITLALLFKICGCDRKLNMRVWRNWQFCGERLLRRKKRDRKRRRGRNFQALQADKNFGHRKSHACGCDRKLNMRVWRNWQFCGERLLRRKKRDRKRRRGRNFQALQADKNFGHRKSHACGCDRKLNMRVWRNWQTHQP